MLTLVAHYVLFSEKDQAQRAVVPRGFMRRQHSLSARCDMVLPLCAAAAVLVARRLYGVRCHQF